MKDPSDAIQAAVHAALVASSDVSSAMGGSARIYDKVPAEPTYPYARIGEDQVIGNANACADGWEVYVNVKIFSRHVIAPRPEAKVIADAVLKALANDDALPTPTGVQITLSELVSSRTFMEQDGVTAHGEVTIRYLVNDAA